jgi:hypothetical protein
MFDYTKHVSTRLRRLITPQAEPTPHTTQVANSAGGYGWPVNHWTRGERTTSARGHSPRRMRRP